MTKSETLPRYVTKEEREANTELLFGISERILNTTVWSWDQKGKIIHGLSLANIRLGNPNDERLEKIVTDCVAKNTKEQLAKVVALREVP